MIDDDSDFLTSTTMNMAIFKWSKRPLDFMLAGVSNKERDLFDKQVLNLLKRHRTPEFRSQSGHAG